MEQESTTSLGHLSAEDPYALISENSEPEKIHDLDLGSFWDLMTLAGDQKVSLVVHTKEEDSIPKPVYISSAIVVKCLSIAFEPGVNETYGFVIDDVIVEYRSNLIGREESFKHTNERVSRYKYLETYVSLGIPTKKYNWILGEASELVRHRVNRNSVTQTDGYTWIVCDMKDYNLLECCTYSKHSDSLVRVGSLHDTTLALKSNLVGVGHFFIYLMQSNLDSQYFLKFTMNKFQLKDRTQKSSILKTAVKTEAPKDILTELLSIFKNK